MLPWWVRQGFATAETAMAPEGQFTRRRWTAAGRAGAALAMDIKTAGMGGPDLSFCLHGRGRHGTPVVLLHDHLSHLKPSATQRPQQHVTVVLQGLEPGAGSCPHRQAPSPQGKGLAVGSQLGTGQARPGQPKGGQMALPLPGLP